MKRLIYIIFFIPLIIYGQDTTSIGFYPPQGSICLNQFGDTLNCNITSELNFQSIEHIIGPDAYLYQIYSDTILFYAPEYFDISIGSETIELQFVSAQILNISSPQGLIYDCDNSNCFFSPNQWGKIILSGVPIETGSFNLNIEALVTVNLSSIGVDSDISFNVPYDGSNPLLNIVLGDNYSSINNIIPEFTLNVYSNDEDCSAQNLLIDSLVQKEEYLKGFIEGFNFSIDILSGWNMIGYSCPEVINADNVFYEYSDNIIIVKNYLGYGYLPEWNFNGIGNLIPGQGYQLKVNEPIQDFSFCNWYFDQYYED